MNLYYLTLILIPILGIGLFVLNEKRKQLHKLLEESINKRHDLERDLNATNQRYQRYEKLKSTDLYLEEVQAQILKAKADKLAVEADLQKEIQQVEDQKNRIRQEVLDLENSKLELHKDIGLLEEKSYLENFGFYESKYDFDALVQYEEALTKIKEQQKKLIVDKVAAVCAQEWNVSGSRAAGKKMENEKLQLMLRAFNGECDAAIFKVKYNNINTMESRIRSSFKRVNQLGQTVSCSINEGYLELKLKELFLVFEFQEKKQQEKEEQRRIKDMMREEERARKEIEAELKRAENEEAQYNLALEKARKELGDATESQKERLEAQIQRLEAALANAEIQRERAMSRAQMTKSGHVYVISNIGSFGEDVYKIGMTRRLEPTDRVTELSGASVPFPFDIHALIYCENAPELENLLHKRFHQSRMNQINERKEFFRAPISTISEAIKEISTQNVSLKADQIQFTLLAEAAEFRKSLAKARVMVG